MSRVSSVMAYLGLCLLLISCGPANPIGPEKAHEIALERLKVEKRPQFYPDRNRSYVVLHLPWDATDDVVEQLPPMSSEYMIALHESRITERGLLRLSADPQLVGLSFLGVTGREYTDEEVNLLRQFPNLTHVLLPNSGSLTDAAMEGLACLPKLTYLNTHSLKLTDNGVKRLKQFDTLTALFVSSTTARIAIAGRT